MSGLFRSLNIGSQSLYVSRQGIDTTAHNIANAQTTRTAEGGPYRRKQVVFGAEPSKKTFSEVLAGEMGESLQEVHATEVLSTNDPPVPKYDPTHEDADENGIVYYPNINTMKEMADMISASRSYEANISAFNAAKAMAKKALEIGRN